MNNEQLLLAITDIIDEKLEEKLDKKLEEKLDKKFDEKLQPIYARLDNVEHRLDNVEHRLDNVEHRLDNADIRFDKIESRLDSLEVKQDRTIKKLNDFQLDTQVSLRDLARGLRRLQDEMETVIEILKMNAMVPQ